MKSAAGTLLLVLIAAAPPGAGQPPGIDLGCGGDRPPAVRLDYGVTATRGPISLAGDGSVTYRLVGDAYSMASSLQAAGLFEAQQTSEGQFGRNGLVPRTFTQNTSRRPPLRVDFDWVRGEVFFSQTGAFAPAATGMQDRLSLLVQLAWRQRSEPAAATVEIPVAGQRSTAVYVFAARATETLSLPAGRFEAVRFERQRQGADDLLEVWLAPQLCSLPVRVRFTDDRGTVIDQQLRAVRSLPG